MITFVVPAHNEEGCIGRTLEAIHGTARELGLEYEVIVADDASTDATTEIARGKGAKVVRVEHRQIAATRNSGARAGVGERIFFVDADTTINARAVAAALWVMDKGAVGGGAPVWVEGPVPLYVKLIDSVGGAILPLIGFCGGAFMFCTRAAFEATGGFSEKVYWAEEGTLALALKREGKFVVIWQRVLTSGRRFRRNSGLGLLAGGVGLLRSPVKMMTERSSVEKIWYDSDRMEDDVMPTSIATRISNAIAFLLLLAVMTGPIWNFVPRELTPLSSGFGKVRLCLMILLSHLGLILLPSAVLLFVNLLRQKRWTGVLQSVATIAIFGWQGWNCAGAVVWMWTLGWL